MSSEGTSFAHQNWRVHALVDFVSIVGVERRSLPELEGRAFWNKCEDGDQLTVQEPTARDILHLGRIFPKAAVEGLEVAVDFWPAGERTRAEACALLEGMHRFVARSLYPYDAPAMNNATTRGYHPTRRPTLLPFERRVPSPKEQLLYWLRDDAPVQVKAYWKETDQHHALPDEEHRVRVEVKLKKAACVQLGIGVIEQVSRSEIVATLPMGLVYLSISTDLSLPLTVLIRSRGNRVFPQSTVMCGRHHAVCLADRARQNRVHCSRLYRWDRILGRTVPGP